MLIISGVILSASVILLAGFQVFSNYYRKMELITPWTLYLLVAVIDVYAPGILFLTYEIPEQAPYVVPFYQEDLVVALTWFTFSIPFWAIGYFGAQLKWKNKTNPDSDQWSVNVRRIYILAILCAGWYVAYLLVDIANNGSLIEYLSIKAERRYGSRTEYANVAETILFQLAPIMLTIFTMLIGVLFFLREKFCRPFLWGIVLPVVGWLFVATTFFRGSQIIYFLSLLILEWQRKRDAIASSTEPQSKKYTERGKRKINSALILIFIGAILFVSYGTIRNYYNSSSETQNSPLTMTESFLFEGTRLIRGEGLVGLTRIMDAYPEHVSYLEGKTYIDMMLLIIPRSIYTDKPDWYGVSDITRGMGGPETTQDAVTIPGEAYANFGILGMPFVMFFGAYFGLGARYRNHPRYRYAYAFVVVPSVFVASWMSLTGLVNANLALPFVLVVLMLIVQRKPSKVTTLENTQPRK